MERVGRPDAVPQGQPVFLGLLPLGVALGVGPPHLGDGLLECVRGRQRLRVCRKLGQEPALDDRQDFVPLDRLAPLVLAGGEMIDRLKQVDVLQ